MSLSQRIPVDTGANRVFAEKARALVEALEPILEKLPNDPTKSLADKIIAYMDPDRCLALTQPVHNDGRVEECELVEAIVGKDLLNNLRTVLEKFGPGSDGFRDQIGYARGYCQFLQ